MAHTQNARHSRAFPRSYCLRRRAGHGNLEVKRNRLFDRRRVTWLPAWAAVATFVLCAQTADATLLLHSTMDNADVTPGDGGTVDDVTAPAEDGTNVFGSGSITGVTSMIVEALDFSGGNSRRVDYGDVHDHAGAGYTVSIWINGDDLASTEIICTKGNNTSNDDGWMISNSGGNDLGVRGNHGVDGGSRVSLLWVDSLSADTWHHVALVIDDVNDVMIGYLDGVGSGISGTNNGWSIEAGLTNSFPDGALFDTVTPIFVGNRPSADLPFDGRIDDFAIWDAAFTAGEALGIYEVATNAVLNYDAGKFDLLKQVHDTGSGTTSEISGAGGTNLIWQFTSGLGSTEGLSGSGTSFTLVLNGSAGTGLTSFAPSKGTVFWFK